MSHNTKKSIEDSRNKMMLYNMVTACWSYGVMNLNPQSWIKEQTLVLE